jgi:hypothetical protein
MLVTIKLEVNTENNAPYSLIKEEVYQCLTDLIEDDSLFFSLSTEHLQAKVIRAWRR